ncbi:MAG: GTP 3',8-cyclase MoaA [Caldisphaera sp.]|uniref:GTP 3',8-cyclase MoaA n=1 Tax=Caldisphaera sp. TaxID=2060322 RepID=UPI003D0B8C3F
MQKLIDAYGRPLENLRIAVTRECNYNCIFCHLEGDPIGKPQKIGTMPPELTPYDYSIIAEAATKIGINGFKITGGEPLVRNDIVDIIDNIRKYSENSDISMTTNGYLLDIYAKKLKDAGLNRVNISIHSLNREIYYKITGVDGLEKALNGLEAAIENGLKVKINTSIVNGLNDREVMDLVEFAASKGVTLQLIELQPINSGSKQFSSLHYPLSLIENLLIKKGANVILRKLHNRPIYKLPNGAIVEVVKSYNNPLFCAGCMRVRLLADGTLIPCINWRKPGVNLLPKIRNKPRNIAIKNTINAFIEVNTLRKPYVLYNLNTNQYVSNGRDLRLKIPKKLS